MLGALQQLVCFQLILAPDNVPPFLASVGLFLITFGMVLCCLGLRQMLKELTFLNDVYIS